MCEAEPRSSSPTRSRTTENGGLSDDPTFELPDPNELPGAYPELDRRVEFNAAERYRFEIPTRYTTDSYVGWLRTDSLVNSVDEESRVGFLDAMERLISLQHDGAVERNFLYEVIVARRASSLLRRGANLAFVVP
jgi:hypothetical protein